MTDAARLHALAPPPSRPVEATGHDWAAVEHALGTPAPGDWKRLAAAWGTGAFGDFLWVLNPFSANPALNLGAALYLRGAYAGLKAEFPEHYPRDPARILPFAITDNGDSLVWLMEGEDPDAWRVAIHADDQSTEETTALGALGVLAALAEGRLRSSILPEAFLKGDMRFTPLGPPGAAAP